MDYYVYKNNQNMGPFGEHEVLERLRNGHIVANDLACRVGETEWRDLSFFFPVPLAPAIPPQRAVPLQHYPQQPVVVSQPAPHLGTTSDMTRLMYFEANKKSAGTAYLLWIFLGGFGAHRFYLGRPGSAIAQIAIFWVSVVLMWVLIGFLTIWITPMWLFIDLFLIPQMVRDENNKLMVQANSFR